MADYLTLQTDRLDLISGGKSIAVAAATGHDALARALNARVPKAWPHELMADHIDTWAAEASEDPTESGWGNWFCVLRQLERVLIGNCGATPMPGEGGDVCIGYALLDEFHGNGYATEAMLRLVAWVFEQPDARTIFGDTFPHLTPSIRVMEKLGMKPAGEDKAEGTIRFAMTREEWEERLPQ